jgi:putative transposase
MEKEYPKIKNKWDSYGIPETLVVDNGKEFVNDSFKDFCFQLGITIEHRPLAKSEFKGGIERCFRIINQQLFQINKGENISSGRSVIRFNQLNELIHLLLVDYYAQKIHKSIGEIPSRLWNQHKPLRRLPTFETMKALFPIVKGSIHPKGIWFMNLIYQSKELQELRKKLCKDNSVEFHVNLDDLSAIYVLDKFQKKLLVVPCTNE